MLDFLNRSFGLATWMGRTPDGRSFLRRGLYRGDFLSFDKKLLAAHRKFLLGANERTPDNRMILQSLAKISDALGNSGESLFYWTCCSKLSRFSPEVFLGMARAAHVQGNLDYARPLYDKAIRYGRISLIWSFPLVAVVSLYFALHWYTTGLFLKNLLKTRYRIRAQAYEGVAAIYEAQGQTQKASLARGKSEKYMKKIAGLGVSCSRNGCS